MAASTVSVPVFAEDADAAEDTADAAEETEGGSSDTPLVVGQTNFSEKFCGMFARSSSGSADLRYRRSISV
ncbi:MAG: hypothetical protein ACLVBP_06665 [Ruminococcus sp.]